MGAQRGQRRPKKEVTTAAQWKTKGKQAKPVELELPSGNVCLVRRKPLQTFMSEGKIPNEIMDIVNSELQKNDSGKESAFNVADHNWTGEQLSAVLSVVDQMVVDQVIEPDVLAVPENDADRDPDELYIDEVDFEDKSFIFQFVIGGTSDIRRFRKESSSVVAGRR
jgi:hypothetical protein